MCTAWKYKLYIVRLHAEFKKVKKKHDKALLSFPPGGTQSQKPQTYLFFIELRDKFNIYAVPFQSVSAIPLNSNCNIWADVTAHSAMRRHGHSCSVCILEQELP
jgi:hypothetical protein